jgi:hypothetical protein
MLGDVNISAILDSFSVSYDKRVRPNYGGMYEQTHFEHSFIPPQSLLGDFKRRAKNQSTRRTFSLRLTRREEMKNDTQDTKSAESLSFHLAYRFYVSAAKT